MKQFQVVFKLIIILVITFQPAVLLSQNCSCAIADLEKFEKLKESNDSAAIYQQINQLKKTSDDNCLVSAYNMEIEFLLLQKKADTSFQLIQKQEKLIEGLSCKNGFLINTYLNYARYYKVKEDYENLSLWAFKALGDAENRKDKPNEFRAITYVVYLFTRQNQGEKNWAYIKRAEKLIASFQEDYLTPYNYNWLAFEYENKFTETQRATLLDSALAYGIKAKEAGVTFSNYEQILKSFRVYESVSYHRGDIRKAVAYMDSALYYAKKIKTPTSLASLYVAKAWDHLDLDEKTEAIRWMDTSIYYTEKYHPGTPASISVYSEAARIFESAGNLPKSYSAFKVYEHLKDSIFKVQRAEKINELEQKYSKAKNEKTIKELAQQKRIYLLFAIAGLLGLAALTFFIRQQSLKNKQKILETEQRLNRARMNPHFFFNALSSLQTFALQGNDGKSMASNLSKFSHIMRETLESTYKEYVTIEQETGFLNEYLELQKMRFPHKFTYEIKSSDTIEPDDMLIPSMILQPFVENSIEHGFTGIDYAGHITIHFGKEKNDLEIKIVDNGKGLAFAVKEESEHISRASQIIKDRIYLLNIKLKTKASFTIDNNKNEKGVTVFIKLPLLYKQDVKK